jgi:hypothetical protein
MPEYIASNGKVVGQKWIVKDMEGVGHGQIWDITPEVSSKDWENYGALYSG